MATVGVSILPENMKEARQLYLFEDTEVITELEAAVDDLREIVELIENEEGVKK